MGELRVLDPKLGDEKIEWDVTNIKEIEKAEQRFDQLLEKGFTAYAVGY